MVVDFTDAWVAWSWDTANFADVRHSHCQNASYALVNSTFLFIYLFIYLRVLAHGPYSRIPVKAELMCVCSRKLYFCSVWWTDIAARIIMYDNRYSLPITHILGVLDSVMPLIGILSSMVSPQGSVPVFFWKLFPKCALFAAKLQDWRTHNHLSINHIYQICPIFGRTVEKEHILGLV